MNGEKYFLLDKELISGPGEEFYRYRCVDGYKTEEELKKGILDHTGGAVSGLVVAKVVDFDIKLILKDTG